MIQMSKEALIEFGYSEEEAERTIELYKKLEIYIQEYDREKQNEN